MRNLRGCQLTFTYMRDSLLGKQSTLSPLGFWEAFNDMQDSSAEYDFITKSLI